MTSSASLGRSVGGNEPDMVDQTLEQPHEASPPEWYVAEADIEIGPLTLEDVEARWRAGELQEDTPVWRPGMADWAPLAEVGDLTYLIIDLPRARHEAPVAAPEPTWKPFVVDSLADLVAWELEAAKRRDLPDEHSGLPSYLEDFESLGFQHKSATADPFSMVSTPSIRRPTPPTAWPPMKSPGIRLPVPLPYIILAVLGILSLALTGILIAELTRTPGAPEAATPVKALAPAPTVPEATGHAIPLEPAVSRPAPEPVSRPAPEAREATEPRRAVAGSTPRTTPATPARRSAAPATVTTATAPRSTGRAGSKPLTRAQVIASIKKNAKSLSVCLKAARSSGELLPGKHRFVLSWQILPDGSVNRPKLKGPKTVLRTSLPGCFEKQMRQWTFPRSTRGSKVKNFPLPATLR